MSKVLLIEDTHTLGLTLQVSLKTQGHEVYWATCLAEAREQLTQVHPDLVILDLGLPDGDGLDLCVEIRSGGSIAPILILTARDSLYARIEGLSAGADDYMTKPFELSELVARVDALLRRQRWHGAGERAQVGLLEIDFRRHQAWSAGEPLPMTELEVKLVRHLLDRKGHPVSREELLTRVWEQDASTQTRTVDVFIGRIRRYIEEDPAKPKHLLNVRGVGYRLLVDPGAPPD